MQRLNLIRHPKLTLAVVAGIILLIVSFMLYRRLNVSADKILAAVRVSFPDFCRNGQVLVTELSDAKRNNNVWSLIYVQGQYWGIQCSRDMFFAQDVPAAIIDVITCSAFEPLVNSITLHQEYVQVFHYGSKMSVCPSDEP